MTPDSPPMSITIGAGLEQLRGQRHAVLERATARRRPRTSPGVALTMPISHGRSPSSNVPAEVLSDSLGARVKPDWPSPARLSILPGAWPSRDFYRAPISGQR